MLINRERGQLPILLDKPRVFWITMFGAQEFKRLTGHNIVAGMRKIGEGLMAEDIDADLVVALFYAGLVHEDESLTSAQVARLVGIPDLQTLGKILTVSTGGERGNAKNADEGTETEATENGTTGPASSPSPSGPSD